MNRRSAWLTDLMILLLWALTVAAIVAAASVGLPRLGVTPGAVAFDQAASASARLPQQDTDTGPAAQQPAAESTPEPVDEGMDDNAAPDTPPAAPPDPVGQAGTARGEDGPPQGEGTPMFPGEGRTPPDLEGAPAPLAAAQTEATPEPTAEPALEPADVPAEEQAQSATTREVRTIAVAGAQGVDLYDRPQGTAYSALPAGAVMSALGRSEDGGWLLVQAQDTAGWAETARLVIFDTALLPVFPASDQPLLASNGLEPTPVLPAAEPGAGEAKATSEPVAEAAPITATVTTEDSRLNVRAGPGSAYNIVVKVNSGDQFTALARSRDGAWVQIALPDEADGLGWVSSEFVELSAPLTDLPVSDEPLSSEASVQEDSVSVALPTPAADPVEAAAYSGTGLRGTLVFGQSNGGTIYAYDLETGSLFPLTYGFDPAVSPDGSTVAFTRDGGENGLYLIDINGQNQRLIYSGRQRLASPKWSPDGSELVFSRGDEVQRCYMIGPGGCIPEESADDLTGPDGKKIELDPATLITQVSFMLSVVDTNGNGFRDLPTLSSARAPDWVEAGVVYQSDAGLQITADIPNFENRLVIFDKLKPFFHDPDWQPRPGGSREGSSGAIVHQGKEASHWEIFKVNPDGTGRVALTRPSTTLVDELPSNVSPAWSPDGETIVFLSNRTEGGSAGPWRLWVMDADGANQRPLPIDIPLTYTFGDEQMVSWAQ